MTGERIGFGAVRGKAALALIALALLLRVLVPAGFMPAAGKGFAITLCTELGMTPAWVDEDGKVHKGKTGPDGTADHPCVFAGFGAALDTPGIAAVVAAPAIAIAATLIAFAETVAIGRGLAAPPPPATGPPATH